MSDKLPIILTHRTIAEHLGTTVHRVAYAMKTRGVKPYASNGRLHIYRQAQWPTIKQAMDETAQHHNGGDRPSFAHADAGEVSPDA